MDRNAGDGADSAEDSGSSQSYTLPGIPKARALIPYLWLTSNLSLHWNDMCTVELILAAFIVLCCVIHAGQCQTIVSTFAGANGRGYYQGSF